MIGKTISHYRILSQIGEGGMGVVYVAEDTLLGRRVAIKIPHAGRDERHYRARFLREARAVSALVHKNIAAVYDLGETDDGQPYIVMELVAGQTLGDILTGTGLSLSRAVEITREVADALSEAHRRGIIHRDIKPSNVIINDRGEVKVLDFGLAKQLDDEFANSATNAQTLLSARTRSDVVIGTPLYLSPEQARGAPVDGRSDLFALGALLYECVAGRPAFSGSNVIEIGAQVLHVDPPPPSRFNSRVTSELDRLTLKALSKRPEDRFQTAEEFAAELARVRARLSDADATRTRRLATVDNLVRSSALITMAEGLRRKRFSPLTLLASLAAVVLVVFAVWQFTKPSIPKPSPASLALYESGVEAMRDGAYFKASGLLKQSVERDPKFALARARLAEAWAEMDFIDRAKDELIEAQQSVPARSALTPQDALYLDAVVSTVRREYPNAVKSYEQLKSLQPDRAEVYFDLGRAYDKNNETDKAIAAFTEATEHDHSYAAAFLNLGVLHVRQKNLPGAATAFANAEKLYAAAGNQEGVTEVHYQRGRLAVEQGRKEEAKRELDEALSLARTSNNLYQQVQVMLQLSYVQETPEQGQKLASDAIELAQASGMSNLAVYGYITLGNLALIRSDYDEAERNLRRALEYARTNKLRRYEALALFQMGSLLNKRDRPDEALSFVEQSREFYIKGGYRKEADSAAMLIGRLKRQKGDYEGALQILEEQLKLAEQSGDTAQTGLLHRECGVVLTVQDKHTEALEHYKETVTAARALHNTALLPFALLNEVNSLWRLGRYDEARGVLEELTGENGQPSTVAKDLQSLAYSTWASMALSQERYPEAIAKGKRALVLAAQQQKPPKDVIAEAKSAVGLAESFTGERAQGRVLCEEAVRVAEENGDPSLVADAQLVFAQALLEDGDANVARATALRAEEFFARTGRVESDWRALVVVGKASRRAGDETLARDCFERARALLSRLEQSWGEAAVAYVSRLDVRRLQRELGDNAIAEAR